MLVIVLIYFFMAQVFLFGAEFIKVLARRRDSDSVTSS